MSKTYGSHRTVVGAHYGVRDWLAQRGTAIVIVAFTLALLAQILFSSGPIGYDVWAGIFAAQWMKVLTFATMVNCPSFCGASWISPVVTIRDSFATSLTNDARS